MSHQLNNGRQKCSRTADDGAVMAEYGLLVTLIAVVVAVVLPALGVAVRDLYTLPIPL